MRGNVPTGCLRHISDVIYDAGRDRLYIPIAGYTGAPSIDAISLLKVCISLIASLDGARQLLTTSERPENVLLLVDQPNSACHGISHD
jgi:hypothetical protein